jgi:hypothetical protein
MVLAPWQIVIPQSKGPIEFGITHLDIVANGRADVVVKADVPRSAHSEFIYTFYFSEVDSLSGKSVLNLLRIKRDKGWDYYVTTRGGIECILKEIRLTKISPDYKGLQLIIAERGFGSYVEKRGVTFKFYRLSLDRVDGVPLYFFEEYKKVSPKRRYCDVNEAFKTELGL